MYTLSGVHFTPDGGRHVPLVVSINVVREILGPRYIEFTGTDGKRNRGNPSFSASSSGPFLNMPFWSYMEYLIAVSMVVILELILC